LDNVMTTANETRNSTTAADVLATIAAIRKALQIPPNRADGSFWKAFEGLSERSAVQAASELRALATSRAGIRAEVNGQVVARSRAIPATNQKNDPSVNAPHAACRTIFG
jgi:hypothetical protein